MTNKRDLLSALSEKTSESQKTCASVLDALAVIIAEEVQEGREVKLPRIGKFSKTFRKARQIRNIRKTDEKIEIPSAYSVKFKPGITIKNILNNK